MNNTYRDYGFVGFRDVVIVDLETTGLDPEEDRIVEICCLKTNFRTFVMNGSREFKTFRSRVNPEISIPKAAQLKHGITNEDVQDEPTFAEIAPTLRSFIGDLPIIGHNVAFDKKFLSRSFMRCKLKSLQRNKSFCTMKRMREYLGYSSGTWRCLSLENTAKHFRLPNRSGHLHSAYEDAMMTVQIAAIFYAVDNDIDVRGVSSEHSPARLSSQKTLERHKGQRWRKAEETQPEQFEGEKKRGCLEWGLIILFLLTLFGTLLQAGGATIT